MNYCSSPVLWPRPECTAGRGATDALPNKSTSTWNKLFQPPLCRLRARVLIASRAVGFVFVYLFVDQHDSSFFCGCLKMTNCLQVPSHDGRDRPSVHPGSTLRKLRCGPSRAVVPDVRGGRVSELHGCNPWRDDSATPHPGSCQRRLEDPRPVKVSRTWRGAEVHVHDV